MDYKLEILKTSTNVRNSLTRVRTITGIQLGIHCADGLFAYQLSRHLYQER